MPLSHPDAVGAEEGVGGGAVNVDFAADLKISVIGYVISKKNSKFAYDSITMLKFVLTIISVITACLAVAQERPSASERGWEGYSLFVRDSLPDDKARGYEMMLEAAWEGDAKSANNVGWLSLTGDYAKQDQQAALRWFERAADQRLPAGALNYMDLLMSGTLPQDTPLPSPERMAKAATLAGTALAMGRGLPYDYRRGEELLMAGALLGDASAAMTIAQQLEMYPDSFSYLPLEEIINKCDALLPAELRNVKSDTDIKALADDILTTEYWYARTRRTDNLHIPR